MDRTSTEHLDRATLRRFEEYHEDELQAALLYRGLAALDPEKSEILVKLAEAEDRHAAHWRRILGQHGIEVTTEVAPAARTRMLLALARRFGVGSVLPVIIRAEAADADKYRGVAQAPTAMAEEEMAHGRRLAAIGGVDTTGAQIASAEGRHRAGAGGALRAAVFGVNDGLVSNFSLVMGVAGGTSDSQVVVLAGVAGLFAGAFSMAAGEWISVRSQSELYEHEIEAEREELRYFPEEERDELELIYRAKGLTPEEAKRLADRLLEDPDSALDTLTREELGIDPEEVGGAGAWVAAGSSFVSFAFGAVIPLLPFLFLAGTAQLVLAAVLSALALASVGGFLGVFTGRSVAWSGLRMVLIGGAAAAATYLIGTLFGVALS